MKTPMQIVVLLALVVATTASEYLCEEAGGSCSSHGLNLPPPGYWPNTYTLNLNSNNISTLFKGVFSGFPNLETLFLTRNKLKEIDLEDFTGVPYLRFLYLGNNNISKIKNAPEGFSLNNLHTFNIQDNNLTSLDQDFLSFAPNLEVFETISNPIVVREGQVVLVHPKLKTLAMSYGVSKGEMLTLGPHSFASLPALESVSMTSAGITSATGAFVTNLNLHTVSLAWNSITDLADTTFAPENKITELVLSGNPLVRLDTAVINKALAEGATLYINDTPMACECKYEALYWWATAKNIKIDGKCNGVDLCNYT